MNTKIVKMIYNPVAGQRHYRRFSKIVKLLKANFKKLEILETKEPPERPSGIKVSSVDELLDKLKNEVGVI